MDLKHFKMNTIFLFAYQSTNINEPTFFLHQRTKKSNIAKILFFQKINYFILYNLN